VVKIIFIDPQLTIIPADHIDLVLESQASYVSGYDKIVRAIHRTAPYVVLIKDKTIFRWTQELGNKYGRSEVLFEERNLRTQLQHQIGISIPEMVTDQQIADSSLLDLKIPADKNVSFEDYLLQVFIGDFILSPAALLKIGEFGSRYEPQQWQNGLRRQLVKDLYQQRLRSLRKIFFETNRKAEVQILDWLEQSPDVLIKNLFSLKTLIEYPIEIGKRVLGATFPELARLNLDLKKIPIVLSGNQKLVDEITLYLDNLDKSEITSDFNKLLSQLSGHLEVEFDFTQKLLKLGIVKVNDELIRKLRRTFKPLQTSPKLAQALDDLDLLISKPEPSKPNPDWNEDQWINWATHEYLPYRYWLENVGRLDDQIAEIASAYADWLYKNYNNLLLHSNRMAWKTLLNLKDQMKQHTGAVLIVLVDNLNTKFYPDLRAQLQHNGFYEHEISYCFSNLPSCTEVSKKSILTGHFAPFKDTAYAQPVVNAWKNRLDKKIKYLSGIGDLRAVLKQEADVYILNYLPLDISLHQSELQTGISHSQAIRSYVTALAQDIRFFSKKINAERDLLVIIGSDHGSTCIPQKGVNVIKGDYYKKKALDEHHRYIEISDTEASQIKENPNYDCYLLDRQLLELQSNYLIARRLYHFRPIDENVYVHGGLTPEETIVPIAIYKPATIVANPLEISLIGNTAIYIGTKVDLNFEVTNLNNYACEQIIIEVIDPNFDAEVVPLETLDQLRRAKILIPARCLRSADRSSKNLAIRASFRFLGQPYEHMVIIPIEIIDPARTKFDLDNI